MKKIVVLGSSGMLGVYVSSLLKTHSKNVFDIDRKKFSITSHNLNFDLTTLFVNLKLSKNDIIINCIGSIPQKNPSKSNFYLVNTIFPIILSNICDLFQCRLIHITTDCVFDGTIGNYNEDDTKTSIDDYGLSKSLCESHIKGSIIRCSIIGHELGVQKYGLLDVILSNNNGQMKGYKNHMWNGVTCLELAYIINYMIDVQFFFEGVRHIHSNKVISKCDLIKLVNNIYDLNIDITEVNHEQSINRSLRSNYKQFYEIKSLEEQIKELQKFFLR